MVSNQEKPVDSATKDISNAVKMGAETARAAKTIGKATAQAVSGNVAGAAVTLVKDPQTLKKLLIIILIPVLFFSMLTVFFLYALPTAIFEAVTSYFSTLSESWKAGVYGSDSGIVLAGVCETIKLGGRVISDAAGAAWGAVSSLWNGLTSFFTADSPSNDSSGSRVDDGTETITNDGEELFVTHEESAEKATLLSKIQSCQSKVGLRAEQIKNAINASHGEIDAVFRSKFAGTYDVWDGTTINIVYNDISQTDAIKLLSAYTVVHGASLEGMNLSDFLRWLGYYREFSGANTKFNLGGAGGVTARVKTWCGTFMPQYLQEQMDQEIEAMKRDMVLSGATDDEMKKKEADIKRSYEQYQGPAADLLLTVDCPDFSTVPAQYTTVTTKTGDVVVHCSVSFSVAIRTRSIENLSQDVIGFWDKGVEDAVGQGNQAGEEGIAPAA